MKIETYVEVVTPDQMQEDKFAAAASRLLRDVLIESGGRYETTAELGNDQLARVLRLVGSNPKGVALALATNNKVKISLESSWCRSK